MSDSNMRCHIENEHAAVMFTLVVLPREQVGKIKLHFDVFESDSFESEPRYSSGLCLSTFHPLSQYEKH